MSERPLDLLARLASGVHKARAGKPVSAKAGPLTAGELQGAGFDELLQRARGEQLESGKGVTVARGVDLPFSREQLDRLARAADQAEVAGAGRAVVLMDGKAFVLDVATRQVIGTVDRTAGSVLTGVDSLIDAGSSEKSSQAGGAALGLPLPQAGGWNPQIARALGRE